MIGWTNLWRGAVTQLLCLLGASALGCASCGRESPQVELPRVAECGSMPRNKLTITVSITAAGNVYLDQCHAPIGLGELGREMRIMVAPYEARWHGTEVEPVYRASGASVILRADGRVPWPVVAWTMAACYEAGGVHEFWLACVCGSDRGEGAVLFRCVPSSGPVPAGSGELTARRLSNLIHLGVGGSGSTAPESLGAHVARTPSLAKARWGVRSDGMEGDTVSWAYLLRLLTSMRRSGVRAMALYYPITLLGRELPLRSLGAQASEPSPAHATRDWHVDWVRKCGGAASNPTIRVAGLRSDRAQSSIPDPDEVRHPTPWGLVDALIEPVELEEDVR